MALKHIHYGPFSRIGDRYATFINPDHFLGRDASADTWIAPTNSSKSENGYDLEIMIPGYSRDEISITLEDHTLEVSAHKKQKEDKEYLTRQIPELFAPRRFELPKNVDQDNIKAKLEHGILKISISEKSAQQETKSINIS